MFIHIILFLLTKAFTCFTTCSFVGIIFCKAEKPGVVTEDASASISGREPKPLFKLLQAEVSRDHSYFTTLLWDNTSSVGKKSPPNKRSKLQLMKFGHEQQKSLEIVGASAFGSQWVESPSLNKLPPHWDLLGKLWYNRSGSLVIFL